jgi:hypothetical protein
MDGPANRLRPAKLVLGGLLVYAAICASGEACAQGQKPPQDEPKAGVSRQKDRSSKTGKSVGRAAGGTGRAVPEPGGRGEPSAAYQESVRQTVERRRERRARRQQNAGNSDLAVGAIVPWPMPPALIIRHTREVHGEVDSLLYGLRR